MKFPITFVAKVVGGSPGLSDWQMTRMQRFYNSQEGKFVQITIREQGKPRSLPQNAYYWGVIIQMISDEWDLEPEEAHEVLKQKFGRRKIIEVGEDQFAISISTTQLSTAEFEIYLEKCRAYAATELGITIPMPHEAV